MEEKLIAVYNYLNSIEVRGAGNVSFLYKALAILETVLKELEEQNKEKENKEEQNKKKEGTEGG